MKLAYKYNGLRCYMSDKVNCFVKENHQVVDASHVIACGGIAKGNGKWYASHCSGNVSVTGYGKTPKEAENNCVSLMVKK